jgi:hypothetical protein
MNDRQHAVAEAVFIFVLFYNTERASYGDEGEDA